MIRKISTGLCASLFAITFLCVISVQAQRGPKPAKVCGDPTKPCKTSVEFQAYDLQFVVPPSNYIGETEKFYAVILKSFKADEEDCDKFIPEDERLEVQGLFPNNKVFANRCFDPGGLYYNPINSDVRFMGVFAGKTKAEATKILNAVKATGKYSGAYIKQLSAGFNGT